MIVSEVITEVRRLIQDTHEPYRYSNAVVMGFINQVLKRMVLLRPDLFQSIEDIPTTANTVLQSCPPDSVRLVEIFQVKNGDAVTEVSRTMLDQTSPTWVSDPADEPVNFVRHIRNPNKFFLYPRPRAGIVLVGEYVKTPPTYTLNDEIDLGDAYFPALVDGTVFVAESIDNEHVNSGRAKMFMDSFVQQLGVSLQARAMTDTETGGLDPKQVIE